MFTVCTDLSFERTCLCQGASGCWELLCSNQLVSGAAAHIPHWSLNWSFWLVRDQDYPQNIVTMVIRCPILTFQPKKMRRSSTLVPMFPNGIFESHSSI
jgi:hypothetical protein